MTITDATVIVEGPVRASHRFGLFSVLNFVDSSRGTLPLAWEGLGCGPVQIVRDPCLDEDGQAHNKGSIIGCDPPETARFTVLAYDDSSLMRNHVSGANNRPQDYLVSMEQVAVETELATLLTGAGTDITPGAPFAAATPFTEKTKASFGVVDMAVSASGFEGLIIMHRALVPFLAESLVATGSVLRTKTGTPVAAVAGWPDAAPWRIIGVPAMVASRGPISTGIGWNTSINDHADYAERDYSFAWECGAVVATPESIDGN